MRVRNEAVRQQMTTTRSDLESPVHPYSETTYLHSLPRSTYTHTQPQDNRFHSSPMAASSEIRRAIIDSVFSRRNASGGPEESYVSHVKVWEDAGTDAGEMKHRYILLSRMSNYGSQFVSVKQDYTTLQSPIMGAVSSTNPSSIRMGHSPWGRRGGSLNFVGLKFFL